MLKDGTLTSYLQINRWTEPNFTVLFNNSLKKRIMDALQQFSGRLLADIPLDKVNYECALLE